MYEIPYECGRLEAINYRNGRAQERFSLETADEAVEISAEADRTILSASEEDLSFVTIRLVDKEGRENLFAKKHIRVQVEGKGRLEALGSADPSSTERYDASDCDTFDGYAMAVIRSGKDKGVIKVTVEAEGTETRVLEIQVKEA